MASIVYPQGTLEVTIPSGERIAVLTVGEASVERVLGFPNYPESNSVLGVVDNTQTVFGPYASGATIVINAGAAPVYYAVGTAPVVLSTAMYRIAATISTSLKFLPLKAVKLSIVKEDTYGIQDYSAFLDVCVRILWRAGVIDCMTGSSVKSVEMTHNKTDRRKVVILVTPLKTREVLIDQLENEAATLI